MQVKTNVQNRNMDISQWLALWYRCITHAYLLSFHQWTYNDGGKFLRHICWVCIIYEFTNFCNSTKWIKFDFLFGIWNGGGGFLLLASMHLSYINTCRLSAFRGLFVLKWGLGMFFSPVEKRMLEKFYLKFMLILFYMIKTDLCW